MYTKIYIYKTIDDWNQQSTDYILDGRLIKVESGIAFIQDNAGLKQYINLAQVFCLVEGI
ncbi:MAG: hypothetical protein HPY50_19670 [Firmicutes bacterium]|nr:hypothetical protein [Bacillota bacterium]